MFQDVSLGKGLFSLVSFKSPLCSWLKLLRLQGEMISEATTKNDFSRAEARDWICLVVVDQKCSSYTISVQGPSRGNVVQDQSFSRLYSDLSTLIPARVVVGGYPVSNTVPSEERLHVLTNEDGCSVCGNVDRNTPAAKIFPEDGHDILRVILLEPEETEPSRISTDDSKVAGVLYLEEVCSYGVEWVGWRCDFLWWSRWVAGCIFSASGACCPKSDQVIHHVWPPNRCRSSGIHACDTSIGSVKVVHDLISETDWYQGPVME
jgi:hypothetical protein